MADRVSGDTIRTRFAAALSEMYQREVPHYGRLLGLVREVNHAVLSADPDLRTGLGLAAIDDFTCEPHGAIRVGTPAELAVLRRVFRVMGMAPVGYYDLAVAGVPVHSTAFRPIDPRALGQSPLRIFTSLLRLDLIDDRALRDEAARLLARRRIVSEQALDLVERAEQAGGLESGEADAFVAAALDTFRWHAVARVTPQTYRQLAGAHRLVADVVAFRGPHINHLTPRTLDIDAVQAAMLRAGFDAKAVIEGPPRRRVPILLRQTSFNALSEPVRFLADDGTAGESGTHCARFGEVEQRGLALTPKGRALYDALLAQARDEAADGRPYAASLAAAFAAFPDDLATLHRDGLAYVRYELTARGRAACEAGAAPPASLEACVASGLVAASGIVYEDFLPVSAAGIFQSNLGGEPGAAYAAAAAQAEFEDALGEPTLDPFALYAARERDSRAAVAAALQLPGAMPPACVAPARPDLQRT